MEDSVRKRPKNFKLISCEIFYREMLAAITRSPNKVDLEFLPKGLHDMGCVRMLERVQAAVDKVDTSRFDAILLGYGLCNNGLRGLTAPDIPLVLPRAHDCITLFFGSKERYLEYFNSNPGVYFKTTGWIERAKNDEEMRQLSIQRESGFDMSYDELVEKYGEDNAKFLFDELCDPSRHYKQLTFIEMGVEQDDSYETDTAREATERGWKYEKVAGDLSLIQRLLDGDWKDREFLFVPPGRRVALTYGEDIVTAEAVEAEA